MPRDRDKLYLQDILEAGQDAENFLAGMSKEALLHDKVYRSAVVQRLTVIGEAAARLSKELRARHPEIDWRDIVGFRNVVVHEYFDIDWEIIWYTAIRDAPLLRHQVAQILREEFTDE